jgi:uncharacterized protein (DUF2147 family)
MSRSILVLSAVFLLISPVAWSADEADAVVGVWATEPDPVDGNAHIQIVREGNLYFGQIVWLEKDTYAQDDDRGMGGQEKIDRENPDPELQSRSLMGLRLLKDFKYSGKNVWKKGTIYDPDNGKTYKCKMKLTKDGILKIRGFIGVSLIGRTAEWTRVEETDE